MTEGSRKTAQEKTPAGSGENRSIRRRAEHQKYVWSYDLVMDRMEDGRNLKMRPVVDESTRKCLALEVERSMLAREVIKTLAALFERRGAPSFIRWDNGLTARFRAVDLLAYSRRARRSPEHLWAQSSTGPLLSLPPMPLCSWPQPCEAGS
jgi:hypothetical protein